MGMTGKGAGLKTAPVNDVLAALDSAEKYYQENLALTAKSGDVNHFRNAAVQLTLVKAFQTSLGRGEVQSSTYASSLLGNSLLS